VSIIAYAFKSIKWRYKYHFLSDLLSGITASITAPLAFTVVLTTVAPTETAASAEETAQPKGRHTQVNSANGQLSGIDVAALFQVDRDYGG